MSVAMTTESVAEFVWAQLHHWDHIEWNEDYVDELIADAVADADEDDTAQSLGWSVFYDLTTGYENSWEESIGGGDGDFYLGDGEWI